MQSTAADGLVRLHNHGSHGQALPPDRDDPLYARLAYSTHTGPTTPGAEPDNHFGPLVQDADGKEQLTRRGSHTPLGSGPGWAASAHRPLLGDTMLPGVGVTSVTLARGAVEVRIHRVVGAPPGSSVRQSGWATNSHMVSELRPLHGFDRKVTSVAGGSTAYTERCRMPVVTGTVDAGETDGLFVASPAWRASRRSAVAGEDDRDSV
ncbi:DUF2264 domain-containing protein, partial [Streptomyces sp. NPDC005143]